MIVKIPFKKENINKYIDIFYFISVYKFSTKKIVVNFFSLTVQNLGWNDHDSSFFQYFIHESSHEVIVIFVMKVDTVPHDGPIIFDTP